MYRALFCTLILAANISAADRAKNIILFLADGMGPSTVNMASIYGHGRPQALYIQHMPHLGWSDTSSTSDWVTDSAAGMTAIVTGQKTDNSVLSLVSPTVGGKQAGQSLKTVLEYAEEHGLSTGLISNDPIWDATPAALFAHVRKRNMIGEIAVDLLNPRFGDGPDLLIGRGLREFNTHADRKGIDFRSELKKKGYEVLAGEADYLGYTGSSSRIVALWDSEVNDLSAIVERAIRTLSRNPKGFFLMVESNNHGTDARQNIVRTVQLDEMVRRVCSAKSQDTLVLVTADHSFDQRLAPGSKTKDILKSVEIKGDHTAEEVIAAADGPGAEKVRGFFPNTYLFEVMMNAWGWEPTVSARQ